MISWRVAVFLILSAGPVLGQGQPDQCSLLWAERNAIFAKNGYCFSSPDGVSYFCPHCFPPFGELQGADKLQVARIQQLEAGLNCSRSPDLAALKRSAQTLFVNRDVSQGYMNVRRGPGQQFGVLATIPAGADGLSLRLCTPPRDLNSKSDWCLVDWRGVVGWISGCCVSPSASMAPSAASSQSQPPTNSQEAELRRQLAEAKQKLEEQRAKEETKRTDQLQADADQRRLDEERRALELAQHKDRLRLEAEQKRQAEERRVAELAKQNEQLRLEAEQKKLAEEQARKLRRANYLARPLSALEQVLNYTYTAREEGTDGHYWVQDEAEKCKLKQVGDPISGATAAYVNAIGSAMRPGRSVIKSEIDIRDFNAKSFELRFVDERWHLSDERSMIVSPGSGQSKMRLEKAWSVALSECPNQRGKVPF